VGASKPVMVDIAAALTPSSPSTGETLAAVTEL